MRPKPLIPTRTMSLPLRRRSYISRSESASASLAGSWARPLGPARAAVDHRQLEAPEGASRPVGVAEHHVDLHPVRARAATWAATS